MSSFMILKSVHMLSAYLSIVLLALCLVLDMAGKPGWRTTPLKWIPHANYSVLLVAAIGLLFVNGWMPFEFGWLTAKIVLFVGYVVASAIALKDTRRMPVRSVAAVLAFVQVLGIVHLAVAKPF